MGNEANPILGVLLACVAGTLVLVAITIWLAKSKRVTSRKALLGLTICPWCRCSAPPSQ